jgi:phage protein D/phage baseplate assembly protein gpV
MSSVATLPQFDVELDAALLPQEALSALEEIRVHQCFSQPSMCELTFRISRDPVNVLRSLNTGSNLRLTVSPGSSLLFYGEITAIEYEYQPVSAQVVHIRAYDLLHRLRKRQPVKVHVQATPLDLARELVSDLSLSVVADDPGPVLPRIIQHRQSSFEMLADVAARAGLYLTLRDHTLNLMTLAGDGDPIELELGSSVMEARVEINGEHACRTVVARGWDAARVERHEGRAVQARSGRDVLAGASPDTFGEAGERTLAGELFPDDRCADAFAQAELDQRAAREVTLWAVAEGNPELVPGARVTISGLASNVTGQYALTEVTHSFNRSSGFVSEISTIPPRTPQRPKSASAAWGRVTRVDDPEKLGRVQVTLPALGLVETGWMGVLAAGAGSGKGFVALPDVGDQVLVLLIDSDPSQGVVLGGLYGTESPGDYGVEGTSVRRYSLATPGGQRLRLDDTGELARLEIKNGSFVELTPDKVNVHSAADLHIDAPGHAVVITGKTVDFRKA